MTTTIPSAPVPPSRSVALLLPPPPPASAGTDTRNRTGRLLRRAPSVSFAVHGVCRSAWMPPLLAVLRCQPMQRRARRAWVVSGTLVLSAAGVLSACAECEREGCDALTRLAPERETGVSGVVAELSDVVIDGCAECPLASATLEVWTLDAAFERGSDVPALVAARPPDVTREIAGSYGQALSPGWHLLCVRPNCVEINTHEGETLTVNVKRRNGPTGFFVGRPSSSRLEEDFGFEVGY